MKKSFKSLWLMSTFAICLSACGNNNDDSASQDNKTASTENTAQVKQILNIGLSNPIKTLDVSKATEIYSWTIFAETYEGLTTGTVDANGNDQIVPAVAKSWETSADGLEWTFHLRDSNWNDGKPVVAGDFKYSIMHTLDPETASTHAYLLNSIKNAKKYNAGKAKAEDVGIKVIDDHTIKFILENPTAYFLNLTTEEAFLPQRQDIVEKNGEQNGSSLETSNMGNGPFKLIEWVPSSKLTLVKNDNYWDAKNVKLTRINYPVVLEISAFTSMLSNGQLDSASVSQPEWIKKLKATGNFNITNGYTGSENYGIYNLDDSIFKNAKIRQAFSLAVTREDLTNVIFHGVFKPAYGWTTPKIMIGDKEYRNVAPEPLLALKKKYPDPKSLLVEGLKELGMDPDPTHLTITDLNTGSDTFAKKRFEYYQQMWHKALGVNVKGEFVQWPIFLKRLNDQEFQVAGLSQGGGYNDPNTFFELWTSSAGLFSTGFKNAEYDTLIDNVQKETDQNKRLKMFQRAETILVSEQAAIIPIAYRKKFIFTYKKVHGLKSPTFASTSYKNVYIK